MENEAGIEALLLAEAKPTRLQLGMTRQDEVNNTISIKILGMVFAKTKHDLTMIDFRTS